MIRICPSVLSANCAHLGRDCRKVLDAGADMIHFDVMDGHFVDNISFGIPVLKTLHEELPDAILDVHLMVSHPIYFLKKFKEAGANFITVHVECSTAVNATLCSIRALNCGAGLAINPDTPAEAAFPYLDQLSLVQVMAVKPGHGGQKFQPEALEKVRTLKAECDRRSLDIMISVDGGVKYGSTAAQCVEAGANTLVVGSAVFEAEDVTEAVRLFKHL